MRLIDADELIKSIDGNPFTTDSVKSYIHVSVAKMPTVEPERKKGRWIDDNCSECGQYVYHGDMRRYCPRCGADMRGET